MKDETLDLPVRATTEVAPPRRVTVLTGPSEPATALTEAQRDRIIEAASQLATDLGSVVKDIVGIVRVRAEGKVDVDRIDALTRQMVEPIRAGIDRLAQQGETARARGEVVRGILRDFALVLATIPELDVAARARLVDTLGDLAKCAVRE
jgi:uncharacterized hydantoinase/oxoprolinase family protein